METSTLLQIAIATTICGLVLGIITFYLSIWIDKTKILKKNNINWNDNLFYPIYVSGKILGCSILVAQLIPSISTTIKIVLRKANENYFLEIIKFISINAFVLFITVILLNFASNFLLNVLFKKPDINNELSTKKYAYPILYSVFFIGFSLVLKEGIILITQLLIPFESLSI